MYTEIVKIDAKGRITIPSHIRLLLNFDEGRRIFMNVDEAKGIIILRAFNKKWFQCDGVLMKDQLIEIMAKAKIISIKCVNEIDNDNMYKCNIVLEYDKSLDKTLANIHCFDNNE